MKRFRRWLFNAIAVLSSMLFLAMLVLWCRSNYYLFGWDDVLSYNTRSLEVDAASSRGELSLMIGDLSKFGPWYKVTRGFSYQAIKQTPFVVEYRSGYRKPLFRVGSFYFGRDSHIFRDARGHSAPITQWDIGVPHWSIMLVSLLIPSLWMELFRRRRRRFPGCCPECGYDMRATPERCPECGKLAEKAV